MPVACLLALGASHSRHHDRCRAAFDGVSFDLSDLAGRTISRRVTVDAKKAMSALLALPMDSGVTIEDLATRVRDLKEQQRRNAGGGGEEEEEEEEEDGEVDDGDGAACVTVIQINSSAGCPVFGAAVKPRRCAPACDHRWLHDGACDVECNSPDCNHDGGDCYGFERRRAAPAALECSRGCPIKWRGDGACDSPCNVAACDMDGGDCVAGPWDGLGLAAAAGVIVLVVGLACFAFGSEHSCVGPNRGRYDTV